MSKKTELVLDKYYSIDLELVDNGVIITSWDHTNGDMELEGKIVAQDSNTVKELGEYILDILDHECLGQMTLYYEIKQINIAKAQLKIRLTVIHFLLTLSILSSVGIINNIPINTSHNCHLPYKLVNAKAASSENQGKRAPATRKRKSK